MKVRWLNNWSIQCFWYTSQNEAKIKLHSENTRGRKEEKWNFDIDSFAKFTLLKSLQSLALHLIWFGKIQTLECWKTSIYHQIMPTNIFGIIRCKIQCSTSYINWLTFPPLMYQCCIPFPQSFEHQHLDSIESILAQQMELELQKVICNWLWCHVGIALLQQT